MSSFITILCHPFVLGLLLGLIFVVITWRNVLRGKHDLLHDNAHLKAALATFMRIKEKGDADLMQQLRVWEMKCRNLELMNHRLLEKPDNAQRMQLEACLRALDIMHEMAPGFSSAWRKALEDAESEIRRIKEGKLTWEKLAFWRPARRIPHL